MVDAKDESAPKPTTHFVDGVKKDAVVFVSQPRGYYAACWGGLMSTRAQKLGARGVIIDGNFRDTNEHRGQGGHQPTNPTLRHLVGWLLTQRPSSWLVGQIK